MYKPSQNPVTRLLNDSLSARVSRRDVFKRACALGLTAGLAGRIVNDYGRYAGAQDNPPGYLITAPEGLADLSGQSITVMLGSDGPTVPWEEAAVAKFNEATKAGVSRISGPESATDRLTSLQQIFAAGASDVDVAQIDVIWPGILATHSVDLSAAMAKNGSTYFDRITNNNTVSGSLVGIPWFTDAGLMYYRSDLLEKYGVEAAPKTWAELEAAAQTIIDGERAAGNAQFEGFVWQGAAYEGLTCDALEWQVSQGGGTIVETDGTVSLNNPNAIAAFTRAKGWVGTISPEGVTTYKEEDSRNVWQIGNAAFMRNWPYAFSLAQAPDSVIKEKVGVTLVPMGEGEGAQHADCLGGWQMMVSKYSKSQDAGAEFARYMTSKEVQKSFAIEYSRLPTIPELYEDADVLAANPFFGSLKDVFLGGAVARPSTVTADLYNEVSIAYHTAINQILTGSVEPEAGVADAASKIEDIMADL